MPSIYEMFATDLKIETDGFVHRVSDKISFTLARAGGANTKFSKAMEVKTRPYRRQISEDTMEITLANKLLIEAFAETVVLAFEPGRSDYPAIGDSGRCR